MRTRRNRGFTLIELMIVVAIVAIVALIAYPSYSNYAFRARRAEGKDLALRIASAEERFYTNFNVYTTDITGAAGLGFNSNVSEGNHYTATVDGLGANSQTFVIHSTPTAGDVQATDSCGQLTLNNTGLKAAPSDTGTNGKCW